MSFAGSFWPTPLSETSRSDLIGLIGNIDHEPCVPRDWQESYSTAALVEICAAREECDFEAFDQAIAGANAELARDFH